MKNDKTKRTKKDRKRLAVQIMAIVLTAVFLAGALFYTIYYFAYERKNKKNAGTQAAFAVTETAEPTAYLF